MRELESQLTSITSGDSVGCPHCETRSEKIQGCNHVRCYVCKVRFCFGCGKERDCKCGVFGGGATNRDLVTGLRQQDVVKVAKIRKEMAELEEMRGGRGNYDMRSKMRVPK